MLDLFHIPSNTDSTKTFYAQGATAWQTWIKPRNAKFIQIFCLGGGASGGAGVRGVAGSTRAGAGGGGSGGIARALYPAFLLPDTLYIQVGAGGASVAGTTSTTAGTTGTTGGISYVSMSPTTTAISVIAQSSTAAALGGASAAAATTNAGGAAATIWTTTSAPFTALGVLNLVAGVAGGISTNASTGIAVDIQALGSNLVTGGAGGGGNNQVTVGLYSAIKGASVISASAILLNNVPGGPGSFAIGPGISGGSGYGSLSPFCGVGGAGGSGQSSGSFAGGNGGNGWYGSGGGGGGAGAASVGTGGSGGKGGDGLVIITTIT